MRRLTVFESISVDGYFTDASGDMSFAKEVEDDPQFEAFVAQNASGEGIMLFGRVTYQMMASFWPTPVAAQMLPEVAAGMNRRPKIVFSKTLREASWHNTTLVADDAVAHVRKLKEEPGPDLVVLGSGSIVSQLADAGLVDEFQFAIIPIALGSGRSLFETATNPVPLRLRESRSFSNGILFLKYEGVGHAADHPVPVV
jgi:dihydrofolate reductase